MIRWCLAWIALLGCRAFGASTLPEIARIEWGYDGALRGESWNPVRVWLRSDRAFSGVLTAEHTQDGSQSARVSVAAACTPGVDSPVELLLAPAANTFSITLTLSGGGESRRYEIDAATPRLGFTMQSGAEGAFTVLGLGSSTVIVQDGAAAVRSRDFSIPVVPNTALTTDKAGRWPLVTVMRAGVDRMPLAWTGYDGAGVVVVSGDLGMDPKEGVDPRALRALRDWVLQGGSLVVQVEGAGSAWSRFIDNGPGVPVKVHEADAVEPGPRVRVLVSESKEHEVVEIAESVKGRRIELTEAGLGAGWELDWNVTGEEWGLLARGPVGFGMVTLVGVDPSRLPATAKKDWQVAAWRRVLAEPLFAGVGDDEKEVRGAWTGSWGTSGKDEAARRGIEGYLDAITKVPAVGDGAFLGIAGCMLLLALLVGPVDALGLKRLGMRQRSWASALAWIALATVGAYAAPRLVRTGEHAFNRGVVEDVLQPGETPGASAMVARSGVTGVFGAGPCSVRFSGSPEGTWWRGVSPIRSWNTRRTWMAALPLAQRTADTGTRECVLGQIGLSQWTYRTMADQSPAHVANGAIGARVTRAGAVWNVEVVGVPAGATLVKNGGTRLVVGDSAYALEPGAAGATESGVWSMRSGERIHRVWKGMQPGEDAPDRNVHLGVFPILGARERHTSLAARLASGRWALVVLDLKDGGCDLTLEAPTPPMAVSMRRMVRLLVPLHPADAASPQPDAAPAEDKQ